MENNSENRYKYNGNNNTNDIEEDDHPYPSSYDNHHNNPSFTIEQHEDEFSIGDDSDDDGGDDNNIYGTDFTNNYNNNYNNNDGDNNRNKEGGEDVEEYQTPETTGVGRAPRELAKIVMGMLCLIIIVGMVIGITVAFVSDRSASALMEGDREFMGNIRLKEVHDFLMYNNIVNSESLSFNNSPQSLAAKWIALDDPANIGIPPVPGATGSPLDGQEQGANGGVRVKDTVNGPDYDFLSRYLMALFYFDMNGKYWIHDLNFLSGDSVCAWFQFIIFVNEEYVDNFDYIQEMIANKQIKPVGVSCTEDFVLDGLFLDDNNMTGSLPTELALLSDIQVINFDYNYIIGDIPTAFRKLTNLKNFYLGQNALWGTIPTWIHELTRLEALVLDHNLLTGPLPIEFLMMTTRTSPGGASPHLKTLALDNNMLTGSISHIFGRGTDLESSVHHILLDDNYFEEEINDNFLYGLSNLEILDLSSNQFYGMVPEHFFDQQTMSRLRILDVHSNLLDRFAFFDMDNYSLEFLALQNNKLEDGTNISSTLMFLHTLRHLDLSNNSLTVFPLFLEYNPQHYQWSGGSMGAGGHPSAIVVNSSVGGVNENHVLPDGLYSRFQPSLEYLFIAHNPFPKGPIHHSLQYLGHSLKEISLKATQLTGTIPTFIGNNLTNLVLLDLDDNELTGAIPTNMQQLSSNLEFLLLNNNQLSNSIPSQVLTSLNNLRLAFFDNNNLTGNLDDIFCDGDEKKLIQSVGGNNDDSSTSGNLPYVIADCNELDKIQCSCCDVCCPHNGGAGGNGDSTPCHENDWIPNVYPQWQYGYNRTFFLFGDRVGFFAT